MHLLRAQLDAMFIVQPQGDSLGGGFGGDSQIVFSLEVG
jgi:hypothetical protein